MNISASLLIVKLLIFTFLNNEDASGPRAVANLGIPEAGFGILDCTAILEFLSDLRFPCSFSFAGAEDENESGLTSRALTGFCSVLFDEDDWAVATNTGMPDTGASTIGKGNF